MRTLFIQRSDELRAEKGGRLSAARVLRRCSGERDGDSRSGLGHSPDVSAGDLDTELLELPELDTETETDADLQTPWNVVVYNDPVNLMPYVTMVLQRIFGYPEAKATQMMLDVHLKGKCVVWSGEKEKAEYYVQQLQSYQLLATMKKAA